MATRILFRANVLGWSVSFLNAFTANHQSSSQRSRNDRYKKGSDFFSVIAEAIIIVKAPTHNTSTSRNEQQTFWGLSLSHFGITYSNEAISPQWSLSDIHITTAVMAEAAEYDNRLKIASNQIPESPVRTTNSFSKNDFVAPPGWSQGSMPWRYLEAPKQNSKQTTSCIHKKSQRH